MKIGIDISQTAYRGTGVANYLTKLVEQLLKVDDENEYILFFSSLRGNLDKDFVNGLTSSKVTIRKFRIPPAVLDLLWNKLHIFPIESFVGDVDVFITSDWTEPPTKKAKKVTILYDLIVYKHPEESAEIIVSTQKSKLQRAVKETAAFLCISEATKRDAREILGINEEKIHVIHPGF
jgi:hypothetical protein